MPGVDNSDLPEFSFSHAVSCEIRARPEYIVLDLDPVRQMESTVTWFRKKWLPIFFWGMVETCGNYGHFGEIQCPNLSMEPMNPEAVSAFQEVLRLGKRWIFYPGGCPKTWEIPGELGLSLR